MAVTIQRMNVPSHIFSVVLLLLLSYLATGLSPSPIALTLLLSFLLLRAHSWSFSWRSPPFVPLILETYLPISLGSTLSYLPVASDANVGSSSLTFLASLVLSFIMSLYVLLILFISVSIQKNIELRLSAYTVPSRFPFVFPIIWSLGLTVFSTLSPTGRMGSWTPYTSLYWEEYGWITPTFGTEALDFLVATGSSLLCWILTPRLSKRFALKKLGDPSRSASPIRTGKNKSRSVSRTREPNLLDDNNGPSETTPLISTDTALTLQPPGKTRGKRSSAVGTCVVALALLLLILPSHLPMNDRQDISHDGDNDENDNIPVLRMACVLPSPKKGRPGIDDYYSEAAILASRTAKILLLPESAIHLSTPSDHADLLSRFGHLAWKQKVFIGITFEAPWDIVNNITGNLPPSPPSQDKPSYDRQKKVNAITLIDPEGEPVFTYFKQRLVPLAESFGFRSGDSPFPVSNLTIPLPASSPGGSNRHPPTLDLSLSAAICHDTAFPHLLTSQAHFADLLLSPSSVWDYDLAWSRLNGLKARARENGFGILMCDRQGISAYVNSDGIVKSWQRQEFGIGSFEITVKGNEIGQQTSYGEQFGPWGSWGMLLILDLLAVLFVMGITDRSIHGMVNNQIHQKLGHLFRRSSSSDQNLMEVEGEQPKTQEDNSWIQNQWSHISQRFFSSTKNTSQQQNLIDV